MCIYRRTDYLLDWRVLIGFNVATDGRQIRETQRQIWIDQQRQLDLALRLFNEGRYTLLQFIKSTKHVTPNFGIMRPLPQPQPVEIIRQPLPQLVCRNYTSTTYPRDTTTS